jgi:pyruvate formate lyase activating enzyme
MPVQGVLFNIQKFSIHDGPGIRTVVFFKGCPLRCAWCSNPESQARGVRPGGDPSLGGKRYSLDETMELCLQDRAFYEESGGGVTLSGGEALSQAGFAEALLVRLGEEGIHRAMETSGYAPARTFDRIMARLELVLFDIKHHRPGRHLEGTGVDPGRILGNFRSALAAAAAGRGPAVLPRIPVIPGYNDSPDDAAGFASLLREAGADSVQLLPFHQFGHNKYALLGMPYGLAEKKALHPEDLADFAALFDRQGVHAFL